MNKLRGLILLDGSDCVGKSTLAEKIQAVAQKLGSDAVIFHLGKPEVGQCWWEHREALIRYVHEAFVKNHLVIMDRHFLSEGIYGATYRQGSEYPHAARHFDRLLHRFRALRVVCAPPPEWAEAKHAELSKVRKEEYTDGMHEVAQRYLDLWQGARVLMRTATNHLRYNPEEDYLQQLTSTGGVSDRAGWYHYDVTEHGKNPELYVRWLLQELIAEQELIPEELLDPEKWAFTGFPHRHAALLVGDQLSAENIYRWPFFANGESSLHLAKTLHALHVDEGRLVIANINDPGGHQTVRELAGMCGRTVALGRQAERTLLAQGIPFDYYVRHPQHARRFSLHDESYRVELKHVLKGMAGVHP